MINDVLGGVGLGYLVVGDILGVGLGYIVVSDVLGVALGQWLVMF